MAGAEQVGEALRHVEVGREVAALRQDHAAFATAAGARAACRRSAVASTLNRFSEVESAQITSSLRAPISRAIFAPTRRGRSIQRASFHERISPSPHSRSIDLAHARAGRAGQGAERVAVEVDHAVGQREGGAVRAQRIGLVARDAVGAVHASSRRTARTGLASPPRIFSGSAISS